MIPNVGSSISKVRVIVPSMNCAQRSTGADECSEGTYATSIPLIHAMDPTNDVMLVFGQNGRVLHPDHGYVSASALSLRRFLTLALLLASEGTDSGERVQCHHSALSADVLLQGYVGGRQVKWVERVSTFPSGSCSTR